jgi:hypothetical protein
MSLNMLRSTGMYFVNVHSVSRYGIFSMGCDGESKIIFDYK